MKKLEQVSDKKDKRVQRNIAIPAHLIQKAIIRAAEETIKSKSKVTENDIIIRAISKELED